MISGKQNKVFEEDMYYQKMSCFAVNHTCKYAYKMSHRFETFDEILEVNLLWGFDDDTDFVDYDEENVIGRLLQMGYSTNLPFKELPHYFQDTTILYSYMEKHGFCPADIYTAIDIWEEKQISMIHQPQILADKDEDMLCDTLNRVM